MQALFEGEKTERLAEWTVLKRCFDGQCKGYHHYDAEEVEEVRDMYRECVRLESDDDRDLEAVVEDRTRDKFMDKDWYDVCDIRSDEWNDLTIMVNTPWYSYTRPKLVLDSVNS